MNRFFGLGLGFVSGLSLLITSCSTETKEVPQSGTETEEELICMPPPNVTRDFVKNEFPKYEEVVTFAESQIDYGCKDCRYEYAKKPEGYYLVIKWDDSSIENETVLIWSAKNSSFIDFDVSEYQWTQERYNGLDSKDYDKYDIKGCNRALAFQSKFDFNLFYGYDEAYYDMREVIVLEENKTAYDYEILGRVYDREANDIIHPGQFNVEAKTKYKESYYEPINPQRIIEFNDKVEKSLEYYDQIEKVDPNYQTHLIIDSKTKIANNYVNYFLQLASVKEEEQAKSYINKAKYSSSIIEIAKMYLDGCESNGIIFTQGDNDTYPLMYVQEVLNYRSDVTVINTSLLNTIWYAKMMEDKGNLSFGLNLNDFRGKQATYILFDKTDNEPIIWDSLSKNITHSILNSKDNETPKISMNPSSYIDVSGVDEVEINLQGDYMDLSAYFMLNLIQYNENRTFNFTSEGMVSKFGMVELLTNKMMSHQLTTDSYSMTYEADAQGYFANHLEHTLSALLPTVGLVNQVIFKDYQYLDHLVRINDPKSKQLIELFMQNFPKVNINTPRVLSMYQIQLNILFMANNPDLVPTFKLSEIIEKVQKMPISTLDFSDNMYELRGCSQMVKILKNMTYFNTVEINELEAAIQTKYKEYYESEELKKFKWSYKSISQIITGFN